MVPDLAGLVTPVLEASALLVEAALRTTPVVLHRLLSAAVPSLVPDLAGLVTPVLEASAFLVEVQVVTTPVVEEALSPVVELWEDFALVTPEMLFVVLRVVVLRVVVAIAG